MEIKNSLRREDEEEQVLRLCTYRRNKPPPDTHSRLLFLNNTICVSAERRWTSWKGETEMPKKRLREHEASDATKYTPQKYAHFPTALRLLCCWQSPILKLKHFDARIFGSLRLMRIHTLTFSRFWTRNLSSARWKNFVSKRAKQERIPGAKKCYSTFSAFPPI